MATRLPEAGSGSIEVAPGSELRYQGNVTFNVGGTGRLKNPRVWVDAYQDLDGDGLANELVYGEGGGPANVFLLGGSGSRWVYEFPNTPAHCVATLAYITNARETGEWNGRGAQGSFVILAQTDFEAVG